MTSEIDAFSCIYCLIYFVVNNKVNFAINHVG